MITLVEKYRPEKIDDIILRKVNEDAFNHFISEKNLPNLLLYGPPGTGKTSTILAISRQIYENTFPFKVLELNASDNRNIQVVRKIIKEFASTKNFFSDGFKLIILDEVDSMTNDAQFCLRRIMEEYSDNVRFCFICNYLGKIIPAIQSRCSKFKFLPLTQKKIIKKINNILNIEEITIPDNILKYILNYSNGDMRKLLNFIQIFKFHISRKSIVHYYGVLGIPNITYINKLFVDLLNINNQNNISEFNNIKEKILNGFNKGYYDINSFTDILFNIIVESNDVSDTKKINLISKVAEIEVKFNNISLNILVDYLIASFWDENAFNKIETNSI